MTKGHAVLRLEKNSGTILVFHGQDDTLLWAGQEVEGGWDHILRAIVNASPGGCGMMADGLDLDEHYPNHRDDVLDVELWFKKNYLGMFTSKQWIMQIAFLVEDDYKRYRCRCQCYRKDLDSLNTYCSAKAKVHGVAHRGGLEE